MFRTLAVSLLSLLLCASVAFAEKPLVVASDPTFPPNEMLNKDKEIVGFSIDYIKAELKERLTVLRENDRLVEAQRLEQRTQYDIEMIVETGYCSGIENYSRYLSKRPAGEPPPCLFDYLPRNAIVFIDEAHVTIPQFGGMYKGDYSRKSTLVDYGFRLPSALDNRPLRFDEFEKLIPQAIHVSATPGTYELEHSDNIAEQVVRPTGLVDPEVEVRPILSQVDNVMSEISERALRNERVLVTTLTKRMAEDLTDYLMEHGIKVRYLHSDIDTVERVEIIRDLRKGEFDALIGINLLQEGLDIPEVSLVAILDADKEGFLRSERSLIQTIGRAARNSEGKAILYADKITESMRKAMNETSRRRTKQLAHNEALGITPQTIRKRIADVMEGAYANATKGKGKTRGEKKVAEDAAEYRSLTPDQALKQIKKLEEKMFQHAKNLEFEQAASVRDQIGHIRARVFGLE